MNTQKKVKDKQTLGLL